MRRDLSLRCRILCKYLKINRSSLSLSELHYKNDKLLEIMHSYVMKMKKHLNIYYISLLLNAYAQLCPENPKYLSEMGPELHDKLAAAVNTETYRVQLQN